MENYNDIMDRLERWRLANNKSKADMSRLFKASSRQDYSNWLSRDSLPKKHWAQAAKLIGTDLAPQVYENSLFSHMTNEQKREIVLKLLPTLDAKSKADAFRLLVELEG